MPVRPRQPCKSPGCGNLAKPGSHYCEDPCLARQRADSDRRRGSSTRRGYGKRHRSTFRAGVLARDRICRICRKVEATVADHWPLSRRQLIARGMDPDDPQHGRGLCEACHNRATSTTDGQRGGWNQRNGHPGA